MITGILKKAEPTNEGVSITIKVEYEHYLEAAALLMKARNNNERVVIMPEQPELPADKIRLLKDILITLEANKVNLEVIKQKVEGAVF